MQIKELGAAVNLRLPPELLERIDRAAGNCGVTRSTHIRALLDMALTNTGYAKLPAKKGKRA